MTGRNIRRTCIDKFTIYFIGEEEQVVLLHQIPNLVHLPASVQIPCRIIRVTNQDTLGAFINQLLKLLYLRQRETFVDGSRHRTDNRSCRNRKRHVVGIRRFRHDNLIPRIQTAHKRKQHSFRPSGSNDNVIGIQVNVVLFIISHQTLSVSSISLAGTIFQHLAVNISNRIEGRSWSRQVRLTNIQVIYMNSSLFRSFSQRRKLTYRRLRHFSSSDGYFWHIL